MDPSVPFLKLYEFYDRFRIKTEPRDKPADIKKHELLVLLASFDVSRNEALIEHPEDDIFIKLSQDIERLKDIKLNVIVEKVIQPKNIITHDQAKRILDARKATILIWGQATKNTIRYVYLTKQRWAAHYNTLLDIPIDLSLTNQDKEFAIEGSGGADFILSYVIATLYLADEKPNQASVFMNEALRFAKTYPQVRDEYHVLQAAVMIQLTFKLAENGIYDVALSQIDRAIKVSPPDMPYLHLLRSAIRTHFNDFVGAVEDASKEIALDQNYVEAYALRAYYNQKLGRNKEALSDCDTALLQDPTFVWVYPIRGLANRDVGNYSEATNDYVKAIRKRKEFNKMMDSVEDRSAWYAEMHDRLASIYSLRGMWKEAIANLKEEIKLGTKNAEVYNHMGQTYEELKMWSYAIASYRDAAIADPTSRFGKDAKIRMEAIQEVLAESKDKKS